MPGWIRAVSCITVVLLTLVAASARAQDKIRVGLSSISATSGSIWVAEEKGLFKKHGIDAEVIIIGGGAARVVSSLIAGEIQFSVGGGDAVIRAALRGADGVLVASPMKTGLQRLMVRPEIKTPTDLKGKTIAVTRFGSASHWVLQLFLRKWGMRPDDIKMLQLGSSPAMFASLEKGAVDGGAFTIPTFFLAEERGYRILADPVDMEIYYLQNSIDSTRGYIKRNRDQSLRVIKASVRGSRLFSKKQKGKHGVSCKKSCVSNPPRKETSSISSFPITF